MIVAAMELCISSMPKHSRRFVLVLPNDLAHAAATPRIPNSSGAIRKLIAPYLLLLIQVLLEAGEHLADLLRSP